MSLGLYVKDVQDPHFFSGLCAAHHLTTTWEKDMEEGYVERKLLATDFYFGGSCKKLFFRVITFSRCACQENELSKKAAFFDSPYVFSQSCTIDQKDKVTMETQKHRFSSPCLFLTLLNLMNGSSYVERFFFLNVLSYCIKDIWRV